MGENVDAQEAVVEALHRFAEQQRSPGPNQVTCTGSVDWIGWHPRSGEAPLQRTIDPPLVVDLDAIGRAMEAIMGAFGFTVADID